MHYYYLADVILVAPWVIVVVALLLWRRHRRIKREERKEREEREALAKRRADLLAFGKEKAAAEEQARQEVRRQYDKTRPVKRGPAKGRNDRSNRRGS